MSHQRRPTESRQTRTVDPPSHPESDLLVGPDRDAGHKTPRWVTGALIVLAIVVLVGFVALHLSGAIGPGLHGGG